MDAYAVAQALQNEGGTCPGCESRSGHLSRCPLINREAAEELSQLNKLYELSDNRRRYF